MAGRPSKYKTENNKIAYKLTLLGFTDNELAKFFEVEEKTINNWKKTYPEFLQSLKKGKEIADVKVVKGLYKRATGFEHEDLYITQYQGNIVKEKIIKYFPPETLAAIFWLKNRQPEKWRDKQEIQGQLQINELPFNNNYVRNGNVE